MLTFDIAAALIYIAGASFFHLPTVAIIAVAMIKRDPTSKEAGLMMHTLFSQYIAGKYQLIITTALVLMSAALFKGGMSVLGMVLIIHAPLVLAYYSLFPKFYRAGLKAGFQHA